MRVDVRLPQWGMGMSEGTIVEWKKGIGDSVVEGEPIAEVEAAKVDTQLESPETGTLVEIVVEEGKTVPIYTVLAVIETR
jgi:pyruvate/2-oxoglutarate dehydrogenase complex dihydrolipoamide acyltransferase (E2) component